MAGLISTYGATVYERLKLDKAGKTSFESRGAGPALAVGVIVAITFSASPIAACVGWGWV